MFTSILFTWFMLTIIFAQQPSVNLQAHCIDGHINGCVYDTPYLPLYKNDNQDSLTMPEAQALCQQTYGSNLASIDVSLSATISIPDQFTQMKNLCKQAGPSKPCWTSAIRNTAPNINEFILDNNFVISTDRDANILQYNEPFFADGEGSGKNEDCVALYHAKNYEMSDWPCDGNGVSIALCANPKYDINNKCLCSCNKCTAFGDPHIYTFDDLYYHTFAGDCTYHYMTPCNSDNYNQYMPIDIFADHSKCNQQSRCMQTIYIQLYDKNGNERIIFKFEHKNVNNIWYTIAQNKINGINIADFGEYYILDQVTRYNITNDPGLWSYLLTHDTILQIYELRIWTISEIESIKIIIKDITGSEYLTDGFMEISVSECFMENTCGLCGYYNGNNNDDLMRPNPTDLNDYISADFIDDFTSQNAFNRIINHLSNWKYIGEYSNTCASQYNFINDADCYIDNYVSNVADFSCVPNCINKCAVSDVSGAHTYGIQLQETCLYDFCKCLGLNENQRRQWNNIFTDEKDDLVIGLGKQYCFDVPKKLCCNPRYCPLVEQNEHICRFDVDTHDPTLNPMQSQQDTPNPTQRPPPTLRPTRRIKTPRPIRRIK